MYLSIIIPAYNEEKLIVHTLENIKQALQRNSGDHISWEMIVCDNNSTDKTAHMASEAGAKIVFEAVNQISRARNTGAGASRGEWLLFIDADTYPDDRLMAEVIGIIESGKYVGCGSTVRVVDGTLFNKLRMERLNPFFRFFNICGGAFIACEKEAFLSICGFSTNLYAYEELDFVARLKRYGKQNGKKFTVLHQHPVYTSGRKGEYNFFSLVMLFVSNIAAIMLFILHLLWPALFVQKLGAKLLGYWYKSR